MHDGLRARRASLAAGRARALSRTAPLRLAWKTPPMPRRALAARAPAAAAPARAMLAGLLLAAALHGVPAGGRPRPAAAPHASPSGTVRHTPPACAAPARTASLRYPLAVRVTVVHVGHGAVVVADVCLDGAGPFPFLVDSGSSISVVGTALVARFHLGAAGAPRRAAGFACTARVVPVRVADWSLGGVALAPQVVVAHSLPAIGVLGPLDGIVGSDVLSRFAAVRVDYETSTLTLASHEGAPLRPGLVVGPTAGPDLALASRRVRADVGIDVESHDGEVAAFAPVRLGGRPGLPFLVDTGAASTAVAARLAGADHLTRARGAERVAGFGCSATLHEALSGPWSLGPTPLTPEHVAILPAGGIAVDGLLGSDVFLRAGSVVVDYRAARLVLESG